MHATRILAALSSSSAACGAAIAWLVRVGAIAPLTAEVRRSRIEKIEIPPGLTSAGRLRTDAGFHLGFQPSVTQEHLPSSTGRATCPEWLF